MIWIANNITNIVFILTYMSINFDYIYVWNLNVIYKSNHIVFNVFYEKLSANVFSEKLNACLAKV